MILGLAAAAGGVVFTVSPDTAGDFQSTQTAGAL
jgi:hypothetical protein